MKHTLTKTSDTSVSVVVTVDEAEFTKAKDFAVSRLSRDVKVQGFRKGKVPSKVAEKNIDPNVLASESVEYAVNAALNDIIATEDLRVLDQPKIEVTKLVPFTTLEFTAVIDVLPEIKLGSYTKLKAKKGAVSVTKAEIDEVIERMRTGFAEKVSVERDAKDGDEVVMSFNGRDEKGAEIEGAKGEDYPLTLGSKSFIPGFEEQLVGHKAGEMFDIDVKFPDDYHAEHLKGAKVRFAIDLKKVNEVKLPEVDDAFAKKSGPFNTAKELTDDIKRELTAQKERQVTEQLKDDLLGELVGKSTVPIPEILIADQVQALERDLTQNLMYRGQTIDQYIEAQGHADKDELILKELRPMAERRIQAGLVLAELSKAEKIEVSKDELDAELAKRKEEAPKMAEQLDTAEARRDLANRVITEKTINRLVEINS
ncbi:MAG: trigger factor [Candidatus Saccharimonadales bacterium]|jgi:trigger factor